MSNWHTRREPIREREAEHRRQDKPTRAELEQQRRELADGVPTDVNAPPPKTQ